MPKLILQFENHVLKTCVVDAMATIGRLPDNAVVVDNPAVSGHHACVFRESDGFIVEDLASTNGTFVNEQRVSRHALHNGDVIRVGKHTIMYDEVAGEELDQPGQTERLTSNPGDTVFLEADKYQNLLAMLKETDAGVADETGAQAVPASAAVLRVLSGRADRPEYKLEARTSLVGKSDAALVRLQGWFKPKEAVAIARNGDGYVATLLGGTTLVNSHRLSGRHTLEDGDILEVSGLTLEFRRTG